MLPMPKIPTPEIIYLGTDPTSGEYVPGLDAPRTQDDISFEK